MTIVALVGCGSQKRDDREQIAARDLYTSNYFKLKHEYAETLCSNWYILSAKHGLLHPTTRIKPYDRSLGEKSIIHRYAWGRDIHDDLVQSEFSDTTIVLLAGQSYAVYLPDELHSYFDIREPFAETSGIGDQQSWLKAAIAAGDPFHPVGEPAPESRTLGEWAQ